MSARFFTLSVAAVAGLCFITSCGGSAAEDDANLIASNDFEAVVGWMADPNTVSREKAHSGHYSVKVDAGHEFGMGYNLPLGQATARKPHKIRLSAWAYMTDDKSAARLGMQLFDPAAGKETFGDGIKYAEQVKEARKWVKITKDITLPETATSSQQLRVFLWRDGATSPAYLDDLRVSLLD